MKIPARFLPLMWLHIEGMCDFSTIFGKIIIRIRASINPYYQVSSNK